MREFLEKVLKLFRQAPKMDKMGFLSSFFKTTDEDFTEAELVDIDIVRTGEQVAPVLKDYKTGAAVISDDVFTGKQIKPPTYSLARPVNIFDLMKRQPGETEYKQVGDWFARLVLIIKRAFILMYEMIKRSIELQASQVLQTGTLDLTDENGNVAYNLDLKPKSTHFPTVINTWDNANADPLADLESLADVIRTDGLVDVASAIFGKNAWHYFVQNSKVQNCVKKDGIGLGVLSPRLLNKGGKYMGFVELGAYRLDLWVYEGKYESFGADKKASFIDPNNVIVLADVEDLDFRLIYGGVPTIGMDEPFASIMPEVVSYDGTVRFHNRVYKDQKANTYTGEATCRPICLPVSIDRFGCMTVAS